jgi:hypothetical protein
MAWLRRNPLAAFLPLQAILYLWNLALLSPWMDEAGTLGMEYHPLDELLRFAGADVHPPLYYLLLYGWQRIPLGLDWAVQARALSVIFALLGTVALDRLWGSRLGERAKFTLLGLWTLSPCLLLYARMSRSYSLQALLAIVVAYLLLEYVERPSWRSGVLLALGLCTALYTHYAAGLALLATANLALLYRRRWREAIGIDAALAVGYLPWIWRLATSLSSWGGSVRNYTLTGSSVLEIPVKLVYWSVSFVMGEAMPDAILVAGGLLLPVVAWALWRGVRRTPEVAWTAGLLATIGIIGVARWVSYPFVPARMLFVLPFFLMLVARGVEEWRWGKAVVTAMLLLSLNGIWSYFHKTGFRNKQYPMPMTEMVEGIMRNSSADDSVILVDSTNSDPIAVMYVLNGQRALLRTDDPATQAVLDRKLADPRIRTVWFLRNTRDVSPEGLNARYEAQLRSGMSVRVHEYEPYTALERALMRTPEPPRYFTELLEFQRER